MMQNIGAELNDATKALVVKPGVFKDTPKILDLCMAPGGFSAAALRLNPTAKLAGVTLPPKQGGHEVFLPMDGDDVKVEFLDITLLAAVMGVSKEEIPPDHPDAANFRHDLPFADSKFDLVFCDGQVLRTHKDHRASYRERNEATRLQTSQLVLAFQRIREGGTLVILLHRVDMWATAKLLYTMSTIADIRLFKPRIIWGKRGSFYLVAENVMPHDPQAEDAVQKWKEAWHRATFGLQTAQTVREDEEDVSDTQEDIPSSTVVDDLLTNFGPRLILMGRPIWKIQSESLRKAPWNRK
jgi:23S rRNA U2552 (ribose-2'-O)-methylase RlmE/FtsJ